MKKEAALISIMVLITGILIAYLVHQQAKIEKAKLAASAIIAAAQPEVPEYSLELIPNIKITSETGYIIDFTDHKILFQKNESEKLPLASLTKIMTAIIAKETIPDDAVITVHPKLLQSEGDFNLKDGEDWDRDSLIQFMLITSSNDAAVALSEQSDSFINDMNQKAKDLSLFEMEFSNSNGLDVNETKNGGYGSAEDIATLLEYGYTTYPSIFNATADAKTVLKSIDGTVHTLTNTDTILSAYPEIVASKTGFTDIAGGNLAVLANIKNHSIGFVILGGGEKSRFSDMRTLITSVKNIVSNEIEISS